jgi:hypothetical protein
VTLSTTALIPDEGSPPLLYTLNVVDAAVPVRLPIFPVERVSMIRFGDKVINPVSVEAVEASETEDAAVSIAGPVLPAASVVELASRTTSSVPVEVHVTETEIDVPELAPTVKLQPVAVPRFEKSAEDIPKMVSPKLMM